MKKFFLSFILIVLGLLVLTGCGKKFDRLGEVPKFHDVSSIRFINKEYTNVAIVSTIEAASLVASSELQKHSKKLNKNIIITSLVEVSNFSKTSDFGNLYSDSMIANFTRMGWNVIDARGMKFLSKAKNGEFYLNREHLKQFPKDSVIFVGTYARYQEGLFINNRILNFHTNKVITAASVRLDDMYAVKLSGLDNCIDLSCQSDKQEKVEEVFTIKVEQDDCSNTARCECKNPDSCLSEKCAYKCKGE